MVTAPQLHGHHQADLIPLAIALPEQARSLTSPAATKENHWLLWQLADSAFPTGGFAHSGGLEAAWQHGEIRNRAELASFLQTSLGQFGHAVLPFMTAAHREPEKFTEFDRLCDAFTTNHVANRASRLQGRALLASAGRIYDLPPLEPPFGHLAPAFGVMTRTLEITCTAAGHLFIFIQLRGLVASAVRLGIVGPMEAQGLQHRLAPLAAEVVARCEHLSVDDLAQTAPLLELWQGAQDRLYSRLFQS